MSLGFFNPNLFSKENLAKVKGIEQKKEQQLNQLTELHQGQATVNSFLNERSERFAEAFAKKLRDEEGELEFATVEDVMAGIAKDLETIQTGLPNVQEQAYRFDFNKQEKKLQREGQLLIRDYEKELKKGNKRLVDEKFIKRFNHLYDKVHDIVLELQEYQNVYLQNNPVAQPVNAPPQQPVQQEALVPNLPPPKQEDADLIDFGEPPIDASILEPPQMGRIEPGILDSDDEYEAASAAAPFPAPEEEEPGTPQKGKTPSKKDKNQIKRFLGLSKLPQNPTQNSVYYEVEGNQPYIAFAVGKKGVGFPVVKENGTIKIIIGSDKIELTPELVGLIKKTSSFYLDPPIEANFRNMKTGFYERDLDNMKRILKAVNASTNSLQLDKTNKKAFKLLEKMMMQQEEEDELSELDPNEGDVFDIVREQRKPNKDLDEPDDGREAEQLFGEAPAPFPGYDGDGLGSYSVDENALKKGTFKLKRGGSVIMNRKVDSDFIDLLTKPFRRNRNYSPKSIEHFKEFVSKTGRGIPPHSKKNALRHNSGPTFYKNNNELIDRLHLLNASFQAGNKSTAVYNEMVKILDKLLNDGVITKAHHKAIYNNISS